MGRKLDEFRERYKWMPINLYCKFSPQHVLVKLMNGYISRGTQDGTGLWWVYDYDNKMRVVSLENPVIEWCWLPIDSGE